jgi:excinuclease ABC subunit A
MSQSIIVKGARVHNLKNVTLEIPLSKFVVVTGVSGSGKSSLAFDTIYAEGQRRYVESLSTYARQFLERIDKPDVDEILGICPAISIRQKNSTRNPRSTVGTVTEVYDFLRLLYARVGRTFCHNCGRAVFKDTPDSVADTILRFPEGSKFYLLFPVHLAAETSGQPGRKTRKKATGRTASAEVIDYLRRQGFVRLFIDGAVIDITAQDPSRPITLPASSRAYVLVDRLVVRPDRSSDPAGLRQRLIDSIETCFREGEGTAEVYFLPDAATNWPRFVQENFPDLKTVSHPQSRSSDAAGGEGLFLKFSERFECKYCDIPYEEPEPRLFSFNSPFGACPNCQGFGNTIGFDLDRVVPSKNRTLNQGAIDPWSKPSYRSYYLQLRDFARQAGIPLDVPYQRLSPEHQRMIIEGTNGFPGIVGFFEHLEEKKYRMDVRLFISRYRGYSRCPVCNGGRLRQEARDVLVCGKRIDEVCRMPIAEAARFFETLPLTPYEQQIGERVLFEIRHRLQLLLKVGLEYLTLDRLSSTLSGGEAQRIQLATALGSSLVGALYVLDEPSIGLHPRDTMRLIDILKKLRDLGNTVLVVEHDPDIIRAADHIIDLGPGAGEHGGEIVYSGSGIALAESTTSLTGKYLRGELKIPIPTFRRKQHGGYLELLGASQHNLKNIDVKIPLGMMVCITGVSGSGKSTLVHDVLYAALRKIKGLEKGEVGKHKALLGADKISEVVLVDQSPIGKTPRSNPVTYIGAFDEIRALFASTKESTTHGYTPGDFSFNIPGGRCEACQGNGMVTVEMQFLADVELVCEECKGTRYKSSLLEVRYRGKNIHDVLNMTIRESLTFFAHTPRLARKLKVLDDVGLGYLRLGQSGTTLSGGEAQRIKLAFYLSREDLNQTLYIFDEPTTGLHLDDISKLLSAFDKLLRAWASIIIIEHNLEVIKTADWIIDLGPEGGERGGYLVATGTPEDIARAENSYTGKHLRRALNSVGLNSATR